MKSPSVLDRPETFETNALGGWMVKVFNNDLNTYEEVIAILIIATSCTFDEAYSEAWEVDHLGSSVVHYSDKEECVTVASTIAQIGIRVEVIQET